MICHGRRGIPLGTNQVWITLGQGGKMFSWHVDSSECLTEISEYKAMTIKQNHKNGDGDKHLGDLSHSQEKIGEWREFSSPLTPLISQPVRKARGGAPTCSSLSPSSSSSSPSRSHCAAWSRSFRSVEPNYWNFEVENSGELWTVVKPIENIGPDLSRC